MEQDLPLSGVATPVVESAQTSLLSISFVAIPTFLLVLFAMCYLFAGLQTWRILFLVDPDARDCELTEASRKGDFTVVILKFAFIVFWPLFFLASWVGMALSEKRL